MKTQRLVTLDFKGTCLDLERVHFDAFEKAVETACGVRIKRNEIFKNVPNAVGGGDELVSLGIATYLDQPDMYPDLLRYKKIFFKEMTSQMELSLRPGSMESIAWFLDSGYHVALGSNTSKEKAMWYLRQFKLRELIRPENMVFAGGPVRRKPEPDVFLETAHRVGVQMKDQVVFDDSAIGLQAARRAGSPRIATPIFDHPVVLEGLRKESPLSFMWEWDVEKLPSLMNLVWSE